MSDLLRNAAHDGQCSRACSERGVRDKLLDECYADALCRSLFSRCCRPARLDRFTSISATAALRSTGGRTTGTCLTLTMLDSKSSHSRIAVEYALQIPATVLILCSSSTFASRMCRSLISSKRMNGGREPLPVPFEMEDEVVSG